MEEKLTNRGSNFGKPGFMNRQYRSTSLFEPPHQSPDLRRFTTRFPPLKCDKQTGHPLADKPAAEERQARSAFNVQRSTFNVQRSTFNVQRSTFSVHRSPFTFRRSPFAGAVRTSVTLSPFSFMF
jgi:hypothetical protein